MHEFITNAASQLGIPESVAKTAATYILQFIKKQLSESDFGEMLSKLPGATALLESPEAQAAETDAGGGGMLGGMMDMAANAIGGDGAGDALNLANQLNSAGLESDKLAPFGKMFLDYAKENVGDELVGKVLEQAPNLKALMD